MCLVAIVEDMYTEKIIILKFISLSIRKVRDTDNINSQLRNKAEEEKEKANYFLDS